MRAPGRRVRTAALRTRRATAFLRFRRHLRRTRGWSDEQLLALQRAGLVSLADALESSPFQRQRLRAAGLSTGDLSSFAALAALAPVTKSDLLAAGLERLASAAVVAAGAATASAQTFAEALLSTTARFTRRLDDDATVVVVERFLESATAVGSDTASAAPAVGS